MGPQSSLNIIYCLIIIAWKLLSFMYTLCIPMQIKPNKSPLRKRLLVFLLWEIGHLSSPSRSCIGRLIFICSGQGRGGGALWAKLPHSIYDILFIHLPADVLLSFLQFNVYNFINLNTCKHSWYHHHNQSNRHIWHLPNLYPFWGDEDKKHNMIATLATNFDVHNTVRLTLGAPMWHRRYLEFVNLAWLKLYTHWVTPLHAPTQKPLATTILFSTSMSLTILRISYKWNHTTFTLLWLTCFT